MANIWPFGLHITRGRCLFMCTSYGKEPCARNRTCLQATDSLPRYSPVRLAWHGPADVSQKGLMDQSAALQGRHLFGYNGKQTCIARWRKELCDTQIWSGMYPLAVRKYSRREFVKKQKTNTEVWNSIDPGVWTTKGMLVWISALQTKISDLTTKSTAELVLLIINAGLHCAWALPTVPKHIRLAGLTSNLTLRQSCFIPGFPQLHPLHTYKPPHSPPLEIRYL